MKASSENYKLCGHPWLHEVVHALFKCIVHYFTSQAFPTLLHTEKGTGVVIRMYVLGFVFFLLFCSWNKVLFSHNSLCLMYIMLYHLSGFNARKVMIKNVELWDSVEEADLFSSENLQWLNMMLYICPLFQTVYKMKMTSDHKGLYDFSLLLKIIWIYCSDGSPGSVSQELLSSVFRLCPV